MRLNKILSANFDYIDNILKNKSDLLKYMFQFIMCILILLFIYGFASGIWRGGVQPFITGIKIPVLIIGTSSVNLIINSIIFLISIIGWTTMITRVLKNNGMKGSSNGFLEIRYIIFVFMQSSTMFGPILGKNIDQFYQKEK